MPERIITLSRGMVAYLDSEDYDSRSKFKWYAHKTVNRRTGEVTFYAARTVKIGQKKICILMHRDVMNCPPGMEVHHDPDPATGKPNTLYNCKCRLRIVTKQEHNALRQIQRNNSTGYKGVRKRGNSYQARTKINGKEVCFGSGSDQVEVAKMYDQAMVVLYGDRATLNFPELFEEYKTLGSKESK